MIDQIKKKINHIVISANIHFPSDSVPSQFTGVAKHKSKKPKGKIMAIYYWKKELIATWQVFTADKDPFFILTIRERVSYLLRFDQNFYCKIFLTQ